MENKDKQFITGLENNLDEIKTEQAAGVQIEERLANVTNTNEQAGQGTVAQGTQAANIANTAPAGDFLTPAEEQAQKAQLAEKRGVNVPLIVLITIVVLALAAVAGMAATKLLGNDEQKEPETSLGGGGAADEENEGNNLTNVEELAVDDEVVQRLYGNVNGISELFDGWWGFYADGVQNGIIDRDKMLLLAGGNLPMGTCIGEYEYGNGGNVIDGCISGEAVRQKVLEMFGKELELMEDDKIGAMCGGKQYDAVNDEFHQVDIGCGGASSLRLSRVLERAEKSGDDIYLYEKAMLFDELEYYHIAETSSDGVAGLFGDKIGEYETPPYEDFESNDDYNEWLSSNERNLTSEYGDMFKWTFTKNAEGNYVFAGLERL